MTIRSRQSIAHHLFTMVSNGCRSLNVLIQEWKFRARSRRYLAEMDQRLLRDIGINQADQREEIAKPFWKE
ncbi:MAG: DUF1127 domain-containing protein [Endozoicomonas sp.]